MSLFLPFNFKPVNTFVITGSYTVPAGHYAMVSYSLDVYSRIDALSISSGFPGGTNSEDLKINYDTPTNHGSGQFWAHEGGTITFSNTNATNSATITNNTAGPRWEDAHVTVQPTAQILYNGLPAGYTSCRGSGSIAVNIITGSPTGTQFSLSLSSESNARAIVSLYQLP